MLKQEDKVSGFFFLLNDISTNAYAYQIIAYIKFIPSLASS